MFKPSVTETHCSVSHMINSARVHWHKVCTFTKPPTLQTIHELFIFIQAWEEWDCDWAQWYWTVMYAVSVWALLLRQHKQTKPEAEVTCIHLRSPLSIFCLFSKGMLPTEGSNYPFGRSPLTANLYSTVGGIYTFALCCISSWHPTENSFSAMQRGMKLRAISPYRWEWHHRLYFLHADQQHLCHPNKMNALCHLRSDNEAKSVSSPGRGDYCQIHATP